MEALCLEIKQLIIQSLELEDMSPIDIDDDAPLFESTGLGLDSIDALEIGVALRKKYQLQIEANNNNNREHFHSVRNLAKFIHQQTNQPSA
ncbi:MAG TPA: phosphopantetheine-binding protein [Methylotenera sp.]|nr:phosphopantetheine-binding protein [Methylotenera sp.]